MDLETTPPSTSVVKCCDCGCSCSFSNSSLLGTYVRSVKRKFDEFKEDDNKLLIPGFSHPIVRVEAENECVALREMVTCQQQTIHDLYIELEEERNASSSAANEAMSMILRLQREKAEIQMEARQFRRFIEEKMLHDQHEILALEDLLYKREQAIQSLTCEVRAYKHRMMSYGLTESEADGERGSPRGSMSHKNSMADQLDSQYEIFSFDYPCLKCNSNGTQFHAEADNAEEDVEKYAFGETPRSLKDLEYRISQLERSPRHIHPNEECFSTKNVLEKVIVGQPPRKTGHFRRFSTDSLGSFDMMGKENGSDISADSPRFGDSVQKECQLIEYSNLRKVDNVSDVGDEMCDREYTIDSVHNGASYNGVPEPKASIGRDDDYVTIPRDSLNYTDVGDPEIKKLYMRLQVLEADRESMRQALVSMQTDKAQLALLKEIAQHLCKDMPPARRMPVKKPSFVGMFSFMSIFKVHVWTIGQQCRHADAFGQGTSSGAAEMSFACANVNLSPHQMYPSMISSHLCEC